MNRSPTSIDDALHLMGINPVWDLLEEVVAGLHGFEYHLLSVERFGEILQGNVTDGARAYWYDIVQRAHLGSVTGLLREHRWLCGAVTAAAKPNFHVFTSCVRGFLEASADLWDGLNGVAKTLAVEFSTVSRALAGEASEIVLCQELEDRLMHLQFAGRLPGKSPGEGPSKPKTQREYLTHLQGPTTASLLDWYGELCDGTHPGHSSLFAFTRGAEESTGTRYQIDNALDKELVETHCQKHGELLPWVVQRGVNLPLLTLKTINELPVPEFRASVLDDVSLNTIEAWRFITEQIALARHANDQ